MIRFTLMPCFHNIVTKSTKSFQRLPFRHSPYLSNNLISFPFQQPDGFLFRLSVKFRLCFPLALHRHVVVVAPHVFLIEGWSDTTRPQGHTKQHRAKIFQFFVCEGRFVLLFHSGQGENRTLRTCADS